MRHSIAAELIVASTVAAGAQTSSQMSATAVQSAGKPAKVSGCLAAGPAAHTFTLTTAEADLKPNPVGTSGVAGAPEGGAPKPDVKTVIYTLSAQPGVDLSAHIGHTVEVSGMELPGKQTASTTEQSRTTTVTGVARAHPAPAGPTTPKTEIVARRMNVSAVKMVAINCHIQR